MKRPIVVWSVGAALLGAAACGAQAQGGPDPGAGRRAPPAGADVQFSSSPPGARSMGMGSTFVGLADDATAAEANPAGLVILKKPEVSLHLRHTRFDVEYEDSIERNARRSRFADAKTSPSFASLVAPTSNVAGAIYYHQSANFQTHSEADGILAECDCYTRTTTGLEVKLENLGLVGAAKLGRRLAAGASLRVTRLHFRNEGTLFFGPNLDFPTEDKGELLIDDQETRLAFNAGLMINPGRRISGGFVYKQGRTYEFDGRATNKSRSLLVGGPFETVSDDPVHQTFRVPHVFAIGVAARPTDTWTFSTDVLRTTYSDLRRGDQTLPDDATEVHVGAEYTKLVRGMPISTRVGLYTDPDHDTLARVDTRQIHVTFGGGIVLQENFQLDAAASFADNIKEGLMSMVYRF